jgi:hypothetical protein
MYIKLDITCILEIVSSKRKLKLSDCNNFLILALKQINIININYFLS